MAVSQLEAWRAYASRWYWRLERRQTEPEHRIPNVEQYHLVCAACDNSITVMSTDGLGYLLNAERVLDEVTRHLRNIHRGLEAEVYGNGKNAEVDTGARNAGHPNSGSIDPG